MLRLDNNQEQVLTLQGWSSGNPSSLNSLQHFNCLQTAS